MEHALRRGDRSRSGRHQTASSGGRAQHHEPIEVAVGPSTYEEMHAWAQHLLDKLPMERVMRNTQPGVVFTTHYSGMGSAEIAAGVVHSYLEQSRSTLSSEPCFEMFSACDNDNACQAVLGKHSVSWSCHLRAPFKPQHVFADLSHVLPAEMIRQWLAVLTVCRNDVSAESTTATRHALVEQAGMAFLEDSLAELGELKKGATLSDLPCVTHGQNCSCFPKLQGRLHVEVAGSTCVGFSTMGKQWQWLHESVVPFLCWIFKVWMLKPRIVVHECVLGFQESVLAQALNFTGDPQYHVQSVVFSPHEMGIPVHRNRRYTLCTLRPSLTICRPFTRASLQELAFRSLLLTAEIFLNAPEDELLALKESMAVANNLPPNFQGVEWRWRSVLSAGDKGRLLEALQHGFLSNAGVGLLSLSQTAAYQCKNSWIAPTLLRSSKLFRAFQEPSRYERMVVGSEYYALQMLPVFLPEAHPAAKYLSQQMLVDSDAIKTVSQARALCGNAMNVAAIGSVLIYALGSVESLGAKHACKK
eukprot:6481169-Amphidinium_carterae.2